MRLQKLLTNRKFFIHLIKLYQYKNDKMTNLYLEENIKKFNSDQIKQ